MTKSNSIKDVVIPEGFFGSCGDLLCSVLVAIAKKHGDDASWPEKYGADVDNSVFMMHPYCWCESEDCPWCEDDAPNFHYKPTGLKVKWYKYIGRGEEINMAVTETELAEILSICLSVDKGSDGKAVLEKLDLGTGQSNGPEEISLDAEEKVLLLRNALVAIETQIMESGGKPVCKAAILTDIKKILKETK